MSAGLISADNIKEALHRAKEIASSTQVNPLKRPVSEESSDLEPAKRANTIGGSNADMASGPLNEQQGMGRGAMPPSGAGNAILEHMQVPDHCVGLVIGRGGEQISRIQSECDCRVQMSPEPDSSRMRQCTLQGTKMAVNRARAMINEVITRAGDRPPPNRGGDLFGAGMSMGGGPQITYEILVAGGKCGLIIGKGGETIRAMQERAGVKMLLVQDAHTIGETCKPLRITGDPHKVENATRMVEAILQSKDDHPPVHRYVNDYHRGGFGAMAAGPLSMGNVVVPRGSVGMIIGKGGETIKRLVADSGAKIQFKPDEDNTTPDRCAVVEGTREQIATATQFISELVNKSGAACGDTSFMQVPATKTGLVIGKGGETIKQICAESGAHVELSREPPPNPLQKVFIVKGTPRQIHHAQHIIHIKIGDIPPGTPTPAFFGAGDAHNAPLQGYGNGMFGGALGSQSAHQWTPLIGEQQSSELQSPWAQHYLGQSKQQPSHSHQSSEYTALYPQPAAQPQPTLTSRAPVLNPQTGQPDYTAQWAEYYRSVGMFEQAAVVESQATQNVVAALSAAAQPQQPAYGIQSVPAGGIGQFGYGTQTGYLQF